MVTDILRTEGFAHQNPMPSGKDLLRFLEHETADWILMPFHLTDEMNVLQLLSILSHHTRLTRTRVSIFVTADELEHLPLAFELGLLSWHKAGHSRAEIAPQMTLLLKRFEAFGWQEPLIAADYLREYLLEKKAYRQLHGVQQRLLEIYPGDAALVLRLAETKLLEGQIAAGDLALHQAELLNPSLKPAIDALRRRFIGEGDDREDGTASLGSVNQAPSVRQNVFGIATCVVVDPDSSVVFAIENLLRDAGVPEIKTFSSGDEAWTWLSQNPPPGLVIQEWRLPVLTGPLLLQRMRQELALAQVPIIVISSLIRKAEQGLVLEMGVSTVVDKPLEQESLFKGIITTLQQQRRPTEQLTLERRIRQLLDGAQRGEASRLVAQFIADPAIPDDAKTAVQAELEYHDGHFTKAQGLALAALQAQGESLQLINLLGKCLLKLGQTDSALKCFNRAQQMSPTNLERLCQIAEAEAERGNLAAAEQTLLQAKAVDAGSNLVLTTEATFALNASDSARATSVMAQLTSVSKLMAFLNNKAVALTLSARFEDGIDLYRRTLEALPPPWGRTHDVIVYNLGLAFARYGNLTKAKEVLEGIMQPPGTSLAKKGKALCHRIDQALRTGEPLFLTAAPSPPMGEEPSSAASPPVLATQLELRRGDARLRLIYRALDLASSKTLDLLRNPPKFCDRLSAGGEPALPQPGQISK